MWYSVSEVRYRVRDLFVGLTPNLDKFYYLVPHTRVEGGWSNVAQKLKTRVEVRSRRDGGHGDVVR